MPAQIEIQNYQSLKNVSLEVKGLTSVTGTNNSGKSALMRAIRSTFQNTPGTHYIRHGTDETTVSISLNGKQVKWSKTRKGKPQYQFPGKEPIFPGLEIPTPLQDLGVSPLEIGNDQVWPNFAPQFTGQVFLLDRPGSALAEAVADVERVHRLNEALKLSESARRDAESKLKEARNAKTEVDDTLSLFVGLDDVFEALRHVKACRESLLLLKQQEQTILSLQANLKRTSDAVKALDGCDQLFVPSLDLVTKGMISLQETQDLCQKWQLSRKTSSSLQGVDALQECSLAKVKQAAEALVSVQTLVNRFRGIVCVQPPLFKLPAVPEIPEILSELWRLKKTQDRLLDEVSSTESALLGMKVESEQVAKRLQEVLIAAGECPLCGDKHDQTIVAH